MSVLFGARYWGTTEEERALPFPCDTFVANADATYFRGVTVHAPAAVIYRWLCQMRVAPYSYDWIDNRGRHSPRHLIAGLDELALGQEMMGSFKLVDFARGQHLTGRVTSRRFGDIAATYLIVKKPDGSCRLLVKMAVAYPRGPLGRMLRFVLPLVI